MVNPSDYLSTISVTSKQLTSMAAAQSRMYDRLSLRTTNSQLQDQLGAISLITGVITLFAASTIVGVVSAVSGISSMITSQERTTLNSVLNNGIRGLAKLADSTLTLTKYDLFEIQFPFLDYKTSGNIIRFVQGDGVIQRAHVKGGGWVVI
jgi:hypothetical protein